MSSAFAFLFISGAVLIVATSKLGLDNETKPIKIRKVSEKGMFKSVEVK